MLNSEEAESSMSESKADGLKRVSCSQLSSRKQLLLLDHFSV